ncbi:uncharacterized protein [Clytia hemisphaerica]|uniref:uncharacterized protein n=1 Tax=Clytia hemisphaerica TaxID=252671 RepID=UPI0034D5AD17
MKHSNIVTKISKHLGKGKKRFNFWSMSCTLIKPRIVDEDGPSEKPLINVSCNVSLINDSVITAIEDQDDIPADSSQMYHNVEDFSDCERSDLLDSDCTLSPFYPPSEYEEIIQSDSEDHDSYLTKRYL